MPIIFLTLGRNLNIVGCAIFANKLLGILKYFICFLLNLNLECKTKEVFILVVFMDYVKTVDVNVLP